MHMWWDIDIVMIMAFKLIGIFSFLEKQRIQFLKRSLETSILSFPQHNPLCVSASSYSTCQVNIWLSLRSQWTQDKMEALWTD